MKKLMIILAIFALMMGGAIAELVYTTDFFSQSYDLLLELEDSMTRNEGRLDNPDTLTALDRSEKHWEKGRNLVLMLGNHTIVRNAEERLVALGEFTRLNEYSDAMVSLRQSQRYIYDLITDNYPNMTNLF